jgi:hypothetical protein
VGYQRKSAAGVGLCLTRAGELLRFSRRSPSRPHPPRGRYVKLAGPPDPDSQREPGSRKSRLTPQLACRSVEPHNQADQSPKAPTTHTANSATAIGAALACFTPMKRRKLRTGRTRQHRQPWTAPRWRCRARRGSRWSARVPPAPKSPAKLFGFTISAISATTAPPREISRPVPRRLSLGARCVSASRTGTVSEG